MIRWRNNITGNNDEHLLLATNRDSRVNDDEGKSHRDLFPRKTKNEFALVFLLIFNFFCWGFLDYVEMYSKATSKT